MILVFIGSLVAVFGYLICEEMDKIFAQKKRERVAFGRFMMRGEL